MNTNPSNVPYVHLKKIEHNHYHLHGLVHLLAGATISGHKRGEDQPVKENTGSEPPLYYQTYTYTRTPMQRSGISINSIHCSSL